MPQRIERDCVIAGGGPAGMVAGYLLARAGLRVTVLEKHDDFFRDFRGDTIHPSTIGLLGELGLRERFLQLPLSRVRTMDAVLDGERVTIADFGTLPAPDRFLVFAPQWDFLRFLADEGEALPGFELRLGARAEGLIVERGAVRGVRVSSADGALELRAPLTIAADGRASALRTDAGLTPRELGAPIDVLWFRLPKPQDPPPVTLGYLSERGMVLTIERTDSYQAGMVIRKGAFEQIEHAGLDAFRRRVAGAAPHLGSVVDALVDWEQVKLLSVQLNRLPRWHRPGFIAIGDAAHAMSPMFGVGVNYAIQDAVALVNAVADDLAAGAVPESRLAALQRRRQRPVQVMQRVQRMGHRAITRTPRDGRVAPRALVVGLRVLSPIVRRLAARFVGIGLLPEHADVRPAAQRRRRLGGPGRDQRR
ncbi:FAD-dependent oxidoreductase [Agrococcus sp. Marseille-P2731]|uniref:FAD-dependent oxidoreductase n=1 Tax=Agrococcus sp. Marseille-P2731 TaxID=1841862 RepID=UPI001356505F|nr:FAD-dependent oxidoreductase [Agrococcus sp. Marseille-P2731]